MAAKEQADQAAEFVRVVAYQQRRTDSGTPAAQPQLATAALLVSFALATALTTSSEARARATLIAAAFSVIESSQYRRTNRGSFTTVDQFFANVVYGSLVLDRWQQLPGLHPGALLRRPPLCLSASQPSIPLN